jgi:Flp pilus assembly protein TadB
MIASLFFEIVALLGIMAILAASTVDGGPMQRWSGHRLAAPLLDAERDLATSLGIATPQWMVVRLGAVTAALLVGVLSGVLVITVVLVLFAIVGLPWLLEDVAARRRIQTDRALVRTLRTTSSGLSRVGNLDVVLREVAQHPAAELRRLLGPLRTSETIPATLVEIAAASRSPFVEDVVVLLLTGRARNPSELVRQLDEQVVPAMEDVIELHEAHRAAAAVQRRGAQIIGAVLALLVAVCNVVPGMHEFFVSAQGQFTLVAAALLCVGSVIVQGVLLRPPADVRWDMSLAPAAVERLSRE